MKVYAMFTYVEATNVTRALAVLRKFLRVYDYSLTSKMSESELFIELNYIPNFDTVVMIITPVIDGYLSKKNSYHRVFECKIIDEDSEL